jgi:hypothetical protein
MCYTQSGLRCTSPRILFEEPRDFIIAHRTVYARMAARRSVSEGYNSHQRDSFFDSHRRVKGGSNAQTDWVR